MKSSLLQKFLILFMSGIASLASATMFAAFSECVSSDSMLRIVLGVPAIAFTGVGVMCFIASGVVVYEGNKGDNP